MSDDTQSLVLHARAGDRGAFARLVELHWGRLVRFARSIVGEAEAEDAVQEALLVAWRKLAGLTDLASFGGWVGRITYRRCLRRAGRLRHLLPLDVASPPAVLPVSDGEILIWQVLRRLAPRQRAVLHLTIVEEMSDSEIGALLGITPASVRSHRRRGRDRLRQVLGGHKS
ncbi:MAG TPA: sigma-70 family RNA polymerase sigma factor [Thermoanaerobaculaceae bacterium]|nr:sigma-70 family RNA polymerase sigma factor [Thermoanaerobaculaceae bacterium]